ncbi:MAG: TetR/AcrR family transcriptional regulator [Acidimicrobiales bacterium]
MVIRPRVEGSPVQGPRGSSRQALIEAAFEEFSTQGYDAATVVNIAERAGVTTGALYAHFRGKLDLLSETLGLERVGDFWRAIRIASSMSWPEAAEFLSRSFSKRPDPRMLLLLDVIVVARRDPEVAATIRRSLGSYLDAMVQATEGGVAAGMVAPALEANDLARLFAAISLGLLVFEALGEAIPSESAFVRLTELLLQGKRSDQVEGELGALARVRIRAAQAEEGRRQLEEAIIGAAGQGQSLRHIGSAAGLSHERVRRMLHDSPDHPRI